MSIKDVFIGSLENRIRQLKKSVRELTARSWWQVEVEIIET